MNPKMKIKLISKVVSIQKPYVDKWGTEMTLFVLTLLGLSSDSSEELDAVEQ